MSATQQDYVAGQYAPRAEDYVTSLVHSSGDDLDQIEAEVRGHAARRCWIWAAAAAMSAIVRRRMWHRWWRAT